MTVTASSNQAALPMLFTEVEVVAVERLSPTFVRVELGGPDLAEFGVDGPRWDQRIKLILPDPETGGITSTEGADETWFSTWLERPAAERGHMRTYTIRDVRGSGAATTFVVDIGAPPRRRHGRARARSGPPAPRSVTGSRCSRHGGATPTAASSSRPARAPTCCSWATRPPCPPSAPCSSSCPTAPGGRPFLEVPVAADVQDVRRPAGVEVVWLAREGDELGLGLHDAVVAHLGIPGAHVDVAPDEVDPDLWETPFYSSSGEDVPGDVTGVGRHLRVDRGRVHRSSRACAATWSRSSASTAARSPSWATGVAVSR